MRRTAAVAAMTVVVAIALSGCILNEERRLEGELIDEWTDSEFYELPDDIPAGEPGEIIRVKQILSAPLGSTAWRVVYHSRDMADNDIPVSGIVIVPDLPAAPEGRTIVSWGHPTTGSAAKCAPSVGMDPFLGMEGMHDLLALGYAIAATDYQGMGVDGPSSYLLGVTEGRNVLDAVRAAQNLPDSDVGDRTLLWGHSQGGQAALFAAQQAPDYAPELTLEGVAVAAPAADLSVLMSDDIVNISGVSIASYAFPAYEVAYKDTYPQADMDAILTPEGSAATPSMAALCLLTQNKEIHAIADPLVGKYVTADPSTTEPWATMLKENSAGGSPIGVPIFVGQGLADVLVIPSATEGYVTRLCAAGESVRFEEFHDITHALAAYAAMPFVLEFFDAVLKGESPSDCPE
jgi:pimeloyl-ACP methyl ester carboxylesterase